MAACKRKEETGVSLLSDEAIKQAFLWLPFYQVPRTTQIMVQWMP